MNKHCYRIIFSHVRNQLMVVSELTRTCHAGTSASRLAASSKKASIICRLKPLVLAHAFALGQVLYLSSAIAAPNIVVDKNAPAGQQPQLSQTPNGTPKVNIQAPNKNGLSHNKYTQFDVDEKGVILNNSRKDTNTQLGGNISGNPNLAGGEANIILNEINATDPSKLNGYIEVAGKKAQVIIANGAGISCDGCGFINANKTTLTTGKPIINGGKLQGYRVEKGKVHINGKGMDSRKQDYTEIIARSTEINAELWGNDVSVITGRNDVSYDGKKITALVDDNSKKPELAVDVSSLGGMYAGKIRLIGTEMGVGVSNAGKLGAQAGSVIIQANGRISNNGTVNASQDIRLTSQNQIENSGTIYSKKNGVYNASHIKNTGKMLSGRNLGINADIITQTSDGQLAAGVNEKGNLVNYGNLTINSRQAFIDGTTRSAEDITINTQETLVLSGLLYADSNISLYSIGDAQLNGKLESIELTFSANNLTLNGQITALELDGKANTITLTNGAEINSKRSKLTALTQLTNRGLINSNLLIVHADELNNLGNGRIYGNTVALNTTTLNNLAEGDKAAMIVGRNEVILGAETLNNREHALIYSGGNLSLHRRIIESGNNEIGLISLVGEGRAGTFNNISGTVEAAKDITIMVGTFNNINNHFTTQLQEVAREINQVEYRVLGKHKRWREDELVDKWVDEVWHIRTKDDNQSHDNFYSYHFDRITYETQILETDPAKLLAGGNINIDAEVIYNDNSQITAGALLNIKADRLTNIEFVGERHTVIENGKEIHWYRQKKRGRDKQKSQHNKYAPIPIIEQILLKSPHTGQNAPASNDKIAKQNLIPTQWQLIGNEITLPDGNLFQMIQSLDSNYLIETDPHFTQYKSFLSSDYILAQYLDDPNTILKRLGDGYYEQQLIQEQISALTGQRYLEGQNNDEAQYLALMTAGLEYAKKHNLTPGVALTSEQMANLTDNMVWLVTKNVTLPDNQIQQVLVPQVYLPIGSTTINNSGALMSGKNVVINVKDELNNSGRILAQEQININAQTINQTAGIMAADKLTAIAKDSITVNGGSLQAINHLGLQATNNINIGSTLTDKVYHDFGYSNKKRYITNTGSIIVHGEDSTLELHAGHDITLTAGYLASLGNDSKMNLTANNNITLAAVKTQDWTLSQPSIHNYYIMDIQQDKGSEIVSNGNVNMTAGNNVTAIAATVDVTDKLGMEAGNAITINSGQSSVNLDEHQVIDSKSWRKRTSEKLTMITEDQYAESSQITGGDITMNAANELTIIGSQVAASDELNLYAGGALTIESVEESHYSYNQKVTKKSGIMSNGGIGATIGVMKEDNKQTNTEKSHLGSMVGSVNGNVNIKSDKDITIKGSDVVAGKDITMTGENIHIESQNNETRYHEHYKMQKTGLTLALSGTVNDIYNAAKTIKHAKDNSNGRIRDLESAKAAMTGVNALQDNQLENIQGEREAAVGVNIMGGSQKAHREINHVQHTVQSSTITGGNITLTATGNKDNTAGDITLKGSTIKATNDINLQANRDINATAAVNIQYSDRNEKNYGSSVGADIAIGGDGNGVRYKSKSKFGREHENTDGVTWTESVIEAGGNLQVNAGRDVNIIGSQLKGNRVDATVGHDLIIHSLQDTDKVDYKKLSTSRKDHAETAFNENISTSSTSMESKWASVIEQSGIFAGDGGYSIYVENNTDLKGAVIASKAKDISNNRLDTGTISFNDIQNKTDFDIQHVYADIGMGADMSFISNIPTVHNKKDKDASMTSSAVEQGELVIRNKDEQKQDINQLSRDTENAHQVLDQIFDKQKELDKITEIDLITDIVNKEKTESVKQDKIATQHNYSAHKTAYLIKQKVKNTAAIDNKN